MADYNSPTVVQPTISNVDITPLERLVLGHIFEAEANGDGLYFFSETGPCDCFALPVDRLRVAYAQSAGIPSTLYSHMTERLVALADDDIDLDVDLRVESWEAIFQDIVQRSATLDHVTVVSAFTCTRMRPDGFGGMAVLVTADAIRGKSTSDILEEFWADKENAGDAYVLVQLREDAVRAQVRVAIETDPTLTHLAAEAVSDADIHAACLSIAEHSDLSEQRGAAEFRAALATIRKAELRQAATGDAR
jgi:hypothetical protein